MPVIINTLSAISFFTNGKFNDVGFELSNGNRSWGPYIDLEPGGYSCEFIVECENDEPENAINYDICSDHGNKIIRGETSIRSNNNKLSFELTLAENERFVEFRIYYTGENRLTIKSFSIRNQDCANFRILPDTYLALESRKNFASCLLGDFDKPAPSNDIIVLQTADSFRYERMLEISSSINKSYCTRWALEYEAFTGLVFGNKPFHATYNRAGLLWFLLNRGFSGWVVYLDADAAFKALDVDIRSDLIRNRNDGKCMVFHPVYEDGHSFQFYGHVNAGAFAIDFSNPISAALILTWYKLYRDHFSREDYLVSSKWSDLMDDQASLQRILFLNKDLISDYISFEKIQDKYIFQSLRGDNTTESSANDLESRIERLVRLKNELGIR